MEIGPVVYEPKGEEDLGMSCYVRREQSPYARVAVTAELIADIRAKAEAATPGPWKTTNVPPVNKRFHQIVGPAIIKNDIGDEDAYHIARMDPTTTLSIISRIAELEAENTALRLIAAAGRDYGAGPLNAEVQRRKERAEALDEISRLWEEFDAAGAMLKGAKW